MIKQKEFMKDCLEIRGYEVTQEKLDELSAWENNLDAQVTTADTELKECEAYLDSYKQMQSSNIQEDFNFGLN